MMPLYSCLTASAATNDLVPTDVIPLSEVIILPPDAITPYVGLGATYDNNVLRLRNKAAGQAIGIGTGLSDVTRRAEAGVALDEKIGQQRINANLNLVKVDYNRFSTLNHVDKNASGNLNWHAGSHVEGNVGASYSEGLTPFIDFHQLAQNTRKQVNEHADAAWLFHPSWRVNAGLVHTDLSYNLASQNALNNTQNQELIGIDYLAATGSTFGLQLGHTRASFPNPQQNGNLLLNNSYDQNEAKVKIDWLATGITHMHFLGGWVRRKQDAFSVRDFSGFNSRLSVDWSPTSKVDVSVSAWRQIGAVDDLTSIYSLNRGAGAAASWHYSEKIRLVAQYKYEKRDFSHSTASGALGADQNDALRNLALTLVYQPTQRWDVQLSASRSTQTVSNFNGGYSSNAVMFNTRYIF
ncbi:XrtB/PEP-CTERM-associated polysaccharide biosynthesis outer membrane protein EpsL [Glaciimonas immobilis]|uniref:Exopolysaccharide biosynthesis operon protein EpsL n=1 Tax=Glaciimonas immobilis TaxID=728004 RepID=A0A840RNG2_9BURK|nr:XrtB/PEP-CTERM-associated polysaccharide biosynthesis outer membrane protein EpsL [Glaciimonas immobilis]MBB5199303.1 exopolysaccharide biosynthesis operon protein EpsL [Glaciimonas immobilis]